MRFNSPSQSLQLMKEGNLGFSFILKGAGGFAMDVLYLCSYVWIAHVCRCGCSLLIFLIDANLRLREV